MSVVNGQIANQTTFNTAFMSRTAAETSTVAIVSLENEEAESGDSIDNIQQGINETFDTVGITGTGDTTRKQYANNNVITDDENHKECLEALDAEFHASTGHGHTGAAGDGPPINITTLAGRRSDLIDLALDQQIVVITFADLGTSDYMPNLQIECDDATPMRFQWIIYDRTSTGFSVDLGAPTISANYKLHYEVNARV